MVACVDVWWGVSLFCVADHGGVGSMGWGSIKRAWWAACTPSSLSHCSIMLMHRRAMGLQGLLLLSNSQYGQWEQTTWLGHVPDLYLLSYCNYTLLLLLVFATSVYTPSSSYAMSKATGPVPMPPAPVSQASTPDPPPPLTTYAHDWAFIRKTLNRNCYQGL